MTTPATPFIARLALLLLIASPAHAQATDPPLAKSATTDINGDGKPDAVSVSAQNNLRFTLTVNGVKRGVPRDGIYDSLPGFQLLRLVGNVKQRYIAVWLAAPSDNSEVRFFLYNGKTIRPAGVVPGRVTSSKSGILYANWWMGFWQCDAKYVPGTDGVLRFVPQAAYSVGKSGTAKTTFAVRVSPTKNAAVVANVAPGSKIQLLLFQPYGAQPTDPEAGYYLIKTQTGLCGWVDYKAISKEVDLPWAG